MDRRRKIDSCIDRSCQPMIGTIDQLFDSSSANISAHN